jgi:hypothetical protein
VQLELGRIKITDVQFGEKTEVAKGSLYVNQAELKKLLEQDPNIACVDLDLARPGEDVRIIPVKDVILRCDITGASGTVIRSPTFTVYEIVPANGKKTVKKFNFGFWPSQGKSFACNTALK